MTHSHDNNTVIPSLDTDIVICAPDGGRKTLTLAQLQAYPRTVFAYSYTTDHGIHGPYELGGVELRRVISAEFPHHPFTNVIVRSTDGFSNQIDAYELTNPVGNPILLCYESETYPLARAQGLVRLVVPSESDNALRQIKWVSEIILIA